MRLVNLLLIFTMLALLVGCQQSDSSGGGDLQGTVTISGAWALYPLMVRWGEEFTKLHPGVQFDISAGGAGKGMADALGNAVDIGMVSRAIFPEEEAKGAFWIPVTRDAVFCTINAANPVLADLEQKGMSRDVFVGIFITGEITTWGQAVGRPEITDPIHVFTRSDACGAAATWAEYLGKAQEDLLGVAVYGDPGLLDAVVKDPLGIGYNNLNYAYDMESGAPVGGTSVVPVDANGNGLVDAGEVLQTKDQAVAAVANGVYPSPPARDLNLVTLGQPEGLEKDLMVWILSAGQAFVEETGYIPLTQSALDQALASME